MLRKVDPNDPQFVAAAEGEPKPRLAIVSTYDELCGIAAYTIALKRQLDTRFDVTVFELDQYLLRGTHPNVRKLGDDHIKQMCREITAFPAVNIQLEYGTLGPTPRDIMRRLKWILNAAPGVIVTFHTIMPMVGSPTIAFLKSLWPGKLRYAPGLFRRIFATDSESSTYRFLRRIQSSKPVNVIVHTRRDMRFMRYVNRIKNVHNHPLSFLAPKEAKAALALAERKHFPGLMDLPKNAKVVGLFGFLGPYKGFETAIRALQWLPKDYHIAIFGAVHPNGIVRNAKIDNYVQTLLEESYADDPMSLVKGILDESDSATKPKKPEKPMKPLRAMAAARWVQTWDVNAPLRHPLDVSDRVHFMGAVNDQKFAEGMAVCDIVVFPYLEVGQTSSGPMSMAIELGCRVIASRTLAYMQYARYHPDRIEFFDIGNHLELAQRIKAQPMYNLAKSPPPAYTSETNIQTYAKAYELCVAEQEEVS
jgi:glycosyltransferase involved in cell wall biosynthesis